MRPVATTERIVSLDILRGAALGGVLLVNLLTVFRVPLSAHILKSDEPLGPGGAFLLRLLGWLVEFKAFTLFSFLFGVGVAIQAGRAESHRPAAFLLRRFGALLAIGWIHLVLVWNGDILALYGLCGLLLIPLLRLRPSRMAVLGLSLIAAPYFMRLPVPFPDTAALRELTAGAIHYYRVGGLHEIVAFRWRETRLLILPLLLLSLPRTLGLMLWGVAAWQRGFLKGKRRLWQVVGAIGAAVGVTGLALRSEGMATIPLAFTYAAALLLLPPRARWLAAGGQMALTNYVLQSVVFGLVFYHYGFGLFGKVEVGTALAGGFAFYLAQLALSRWWLKRFCFGPLEWLWRSFSYRRWQPLLREDARTISRGALQMMLATTFLIVMPLIHLGGPLLLGRFGPRWGWSGGYPALLNLLGALPVVAGASLLVWVLSTMIGEVRTLPPLVRLGVRPARLVQTGPYAWMRHPTYLGEGCFWVGMIVFLGSPVAATVFAGLLLVCLGWIVRREDRALEEQFGDEYRAFRARVPPLPGFRRAG